MLKHIQWNLGPMSCIRDFQHHARSPMLEMKGAHGLASKFQVKSLLSYMTLKHVTALLFLLMSNLARSLIFSNTICFFPILRKAELFKCWCHAVCTLLCFLEFYNFLYTIRCPKDVCCPCSDSRVNVPISRQLPENTEQPFWPVHWAWGFQLLEDSESFQI